MDVLYATFNNVRACLGLSDRELSDAEIANLAADTMVEIELDAVYPDHAVIFTAVDGGTATADQTKIWRLLINFCAYQTAVFMLPQLQNISFQMISDGDAESRRFMSNDLKQLKTEVLGMLNYVKTLLKGTSFTVESVSLNVLAVAAPTYDPVTNEGAT